MEGELFSQLAISGRTFWRPNPEPLTQLHLKNLAEIPGPLLIVAYPDTRAAARLRRLVLAYPYQPALWVWVPQVQGLALHATLGETEATHQLATLRKLSALVGPIGVLADTSAALTDSEHFLELIAPYASALHFMTPTKGTDAPLQARLSSIRAARNGTPPAY